MRELQGARVALVHDWLITWGGAESVLQSLAGLFPSAPIYTALWNPVERVRRTFGHREIRTTWLQSIPGAKNRHRRVLPLLPGAFRSLDLTAFDLVVSDSHAFSKAVRVRPGAVHLCYCHTPPRYLWDLQAEYLGRRARAMLRPLIGWLRRQDLTAAGGVTHFAANSRFVAERIRRVYEREARVIYPPVDVEPFLMEERREGEYFLAGGRLVPYKRVDLAVAAANAGRFPLKVFGDGPERRRLERLAGPTVEFLGALEAPDLARVFSRARAFLFPGIEDFGILPVEAQAAGVPVLARGEGGVRESVVEGETGVFVTSAAVDTWVAGVERIGESGLSPESCRSNAARFGRRSFEESMASALSDALSVSV